MSEEANIQEFEPRPSEYTVDPVARAIDADRLRNGTLT
jgi:hypothetical protein